MTAAHEFLPAAVERARAGNFLLLDALELLAQPSETKSAVRLGGRIAWLCIDTAAGEFNIDAPNCCCWEGCEECNGVDNSFDCFESIGADARQVFAGDPEFDKLAGLNRFDRSDARQVLHNYRIELAKAKAAATAAPAIQQELA